MFFDFVFFVFYILGVWFYVIVKYEILKNFDLRGVIWVVIIFCCDFFYFWKMVIWNIWEIMMFYMIIYVK